MTIQTVKLSALLVADENARKGVDDDALDALAASIAAVGLVQPLSAYERDGTFYVDDGGRRLAALRRLSKAKRLPATLKGGVPVWLHPAPEQAPERSLAANVVRRAMTPGQELAVYKRLFEAGRTAPEISAACAVAEKRVRQLLRLVCVAPSILDRFIRGELALDVVEACSVSDDHARQVQALEAASRFHAGAQAGSIRHQLRTGALHGSTALARFVGRDAYERAGGAFVVDLFSAYDDDGEEWADKGLAERLALERLAPDVDALKGEGWGKVIVPPGAAAYAAPNLVTLEPLDDGGWSAAERAALTCVVCLSPDAEVERRLAQGSWNQIEGLRRERERARAAAEAEARAAEAAETAADAAPAAVDAAEAMPPVIALPDAPRPVAARPEPWGGQMAEREAEEAAYLARRAALCAALAASPGDAMAVVLWEVARNVFGSHGVLGECETGAADPAFGRDADAWSERLPDDDAGLLASILALTAEERADLASVCARALVAGALHGDDVDALEGLIGDDDATPDLFVSEPAPFGSEAETEDDRRAASGRDVYAWADPAVLMAAE